jgi:hypothetical protein
MNWYTVFYLFSLSDKISDTMFTLSVLASIISGISLCIWCIGQVDGDEFNKARRWFLTTFPIAFIAWSLWAFIPDRNDMLLIVAGGSVGEFITNDENAKELPTDITRFLRKEILEATMEDGNVVVREALGVKSTKDKLMELSKDELVKMLEESNETQ